MIRLLLSGLLAAAGLGSLLTFQAIATPSAITCQEDEARIEYGNVDTCWHAESLVMVGEPGYGAYLVSCDASTSRLTCNDEFVRIVEGAR